jgi:hypothetical protein
MPELFTEHCVVAELKDGRVIAQARYSQVVSSGDSAINVRVPDLREVEHVLQVEFYSNPDTSVQEGFMDKKITGNIVGMTVYEVEATTTLTTEVIAIGPP